MDEPNTSLSNKVLFDTFCTIMSADENFRSRVIRIASEYGSELCSAIEVMGGKSILMANYEKTKQYSPELVRKSIKETLNKHSPDNVPIRKILSEIRKYEELRTLTRTNLYWYLNHTEGIMRHAHGIYSLTSNMIQQDIEEGELYT